MLSSLLGSVNKERVLVYIVARDKGYAREIARFFDAPMNPVLKALEKLEEAGVLVSQAVGTTRQYQLNPRYPAKAQVTALVQRAIAFYPAALRERLLMRRTRPRRKGKPL